MSITRNSFKRPAALFAAAAVLVGAAVPALLTVSNADAAQLSTRSIQMSDSGPSGGSLTSGVGSGTSVKYKLSFTTVHATSMQSFIVDFCANTPLVADTTCSAPTGFTTSGATLTANGTWALATTATQWKITDSTAHAAGTYEFEVNGITNPSTNGTFYARIYTYSDATASTYVGYGNLGTHLDDGGVALATTAPIKITARVMETMSLCTSAADLTALACAGATTPDLVLGHGANFVLDDSIIDTKAAYTQVSTNASNGYDVYMRAHNTCGGGLSKDDGATCLIPAINSGSATASLMAAGTAAFGVDISDGTAVAGGSGSNSAVTRWNPTTANNYIMDEVTSNDHVGYTYGSRIFSSTGQANSVKNTLLFAATASPTTPAGIYTQHFSVIGVGRF